MLRSEHRILTTHTGSLPRSPALTDLYARRSRGEAVDEAALDAAEAAPWPDAAAAFTDVQTTGAGVWR